MRFNVRYLVAGLGVVAAAMLMVAAGWMNWKFMTSYGSSVEDKLALGLASIGIDLMKAALGYLTALAWDKRQWGHVILSSALFAGLACFSLSSSMGFGAETRDVVLSQGKALAARYEAAKRELDETDAKLRALGGARSLVVIEGQIQHLERNGLWNSSRGCTAIRGPAAASFCIKHGELKYELVRAREVARLELARKAHRDRVADLEDHGALRSVNRQGKMLTWISGFSEETASKVIVLLLAMGLEFGAGLGLYLALRPVSEKSVERLRKKEEVENVQLKREDASVEKGAEVSAKATDIVDNSGFKGKKADLGNRNDGRRSRKPRREELN